MAKVFEGLPNPIEANRIIRSGHVSQSVDAFTGAEAYDITLSGSLTVTGSIGWNGAQDASGATVETVVRDTTSGLLYVTASVGGGTDYISNVAFTSPDLTFTGVGSAFNGNVDISDLTGSLLSTASFNAATSSFLPDTPDRSVQFNDNGAFGGSDLYYFTSSGKFTTNESVTATAKFNILDTAASLDWGKDNAAGRLTYNSNSNRSGSAIIGLPGNDPAVNKPGNLYISNDNEARPRFFVSASGKVAINYEEDSGPATEPQFDADVQFGSTLDQVEVFISGTLAVSSLPGTTEPNVIYYNTESGVFSYGAGGGGGTGPQGPQGPQGPTGPASNVQGPQGPQGPTGPASNVQGPQGPQGPTGPASNVQGPQGPQGPTGPASNVQGPQGPQGPTGPASNVQGPQGPQGPTGPASNVQGPQGPQGPTGPSGAAIITGSYTGSLLTTTISSINWTGSGVQATSTGNDITVYVPDTNFANTNLLFDGNREHELDGYGLTISNVGNTASDVVFYLRGDGSGVSGSFTVNRTDGIFFPQIASQTTSDVVYFDNTNGRISYGSAPSGGGTAITASYASSVLTTSAQSFDFTGNLMNATAVGNAVTVTVNSGSVNKVNLTTTTANADYRVLLVDETGLTDETLYVDSNDGLTFNPSLNYLQSKGEVIAYYASDRRLKDNITPISNPLEKLAKINGYEFDWNENQQVYKGHDVGVIAQEIEEILPELVTTRDNGDKAVKYEKLAAFLISVVKEQQNQIDELKSRL